MTYSDIHLPLRRSKLPPNTERPFQRPNPSHNLNSSPNISAAAFIALDWTLLTLALIPITIRLSLRTRNRGLHTPSANLADTFVILAWLSGCVLISINTWKNTLRMQYLSAPPASLYYGVPPHLSAHLLHISWLSLFFIYTSLWSAKAAFLAFYYSIFSLQGRRAQIALFAACLFTLATFLLHMLLIAFWCSPVSANWAPPPGGRLCSAVHSMASVTISTLANVATDLVILGIPISTLAATQLGSRERAGLVFVFVMSGISIVAALVRFVCLKLVQETPRASITHTIDVWALVEIVSSILAVCLPCMRTFVRRNRGLGLAKGSKAGKGVADSIESVGERRARGEMDENGV
ncbi:hypothetical protein P153DRAFT_366771 [Dothidotthia symphoricarpi CBS 119687]|uniref:Rhodopsin domain-containing protein n=1 Tax=Dothidotthia symphoricarpi CBS 119687 TaxID=1392245 RepID=A0A6A6AE46_9PLEO|nr:uncharacterized protein P153DRAFT_366771 [Dothidotthia symphoricarpi CBS 119687]KAF2129375.1 hypothetical protein P153DRAFT_366771 [Dothidotthia symphoricarpi CBS 119687]